MEDFKARRIAVIGVSESPEKYGHKIFADLLKAGYNVFGINPKGGEVEGKKLFSSIREINPLSEMVILVVPPKVTEQIVEEMNVLGIKRLWMQSGSESEEAVAKARKYGIWKRENKTSG